MVLMCFMMYIKGEVPEQAMEACRGSRGIASPILILDTRGG
jgi:hypothetical protein